MLRLSFFARPTWTPRGVLAVSATETGRRDHLINADEAHFAAAGDRRSIARVPGAPFAASAAMDRFLMRRT